MKKLFISLVLVVVFSVFGLGWLGTQIYTSMDGGEVEGSKDDIFAYKEVGRNLASAIDRNKDGAIVFDAFWPRNSRLSPSVIAREEFNLPLALTANFESGEVLVLEDEEVITLSFYLKNTQQVLTLSLPKSLVLHKKTNVGFTLTLLFYFGIVIVVLVWLYPLINRLMLLQRSTSAFGSGELEARIGECRWTYIPEIEQAFDRMAERIQNLVSDNKLLSRAVSHDLKTPLARLRFGVETLEETQDDMLRDKYHKRISRDLNEMESLVNTLLQYAKLDEGNIKLNKEELDINVLVSQLSQEYECDETEIALELGVQDNLVSADKIYLKMLVNNILANALQYNKCRVLIKTEKINNRVCLTIADDGEGIPELERDNILKPFVRGSVKTEYKGHGMGLAIVTKIAEWHGAKVSVGTSAELGGAEFKVWFF